MGELWLSVLFNTFIVIAVIVLLFVFLKKSKRMKVQGDAPLQIVASLNLSMREKIIIVAVGQQQIVCGITQSQITPLSVLRDENEKIQCGSMTSTFRENLSQILQSASKSD